MFRVDDDLTPERTHVPIASAEHIRSPIRPVAHFFTIPDYETIIRATLHGDRDYGSL
jgi:hypothetical protein